MLNNFADVLANRFAQFKGRATRKEFWLFTLVVFIFQILFFIALLFIGGYTYGTFAATAIFWIVFSLYMAFIAALFVPMLALQIRRLHDIGRRWTAIFLAFIPFIGGIWLIVLLATKSQQGVNQFG